MSGPIAQLLSLVSYGRHFLQTGKMVTPSYYPNNGIFKFCNSVDFRHLNLSRISTRQDEQIIAQNPTIWFDFLKQNNCQQLKAYYEPFKSNDLKTPEHMLAGFVGGSGTWLIEAVYSSYSDFWANRWEVTRRNDTDRKIWSVSYGRTQVQQPTANFCPDVQQTKEILTNNLTAIQSFAKKHQLDNWAAIFQNALRVLHSSESEAVFNQALIDKFNYPLPALQLIYSAIAAYVFGGMGSWNDLAFETKEEYEEYQKLSVSLYSSINRAFISGINSTK
jgi:hypothetical protein